MKAIERGGLFVVKERIFWYSRGREKERSFLLQKRTPKLVVFMWSDLHP